MRPSPLYKPEGIDHPAFHLRYAWTGWPHSGEAFPPKPDEGFFSELAERYEVDGIRLLESNWRTDRIQFTCSVKPQVTPILFTSRLKGRLQHALRASGLNTRFSRKVAFRTIGDNTRTAVERYVANQVAKERFIDDRFSSMLVEFSVQDPHVDLRVPQSTLSGRYWYNLHLVMVTESRLRFTDETSLTKLSRMCVAVAKKKGHRVSARSVMPDHIHLALGGVVEESPEEIALAYMNNTSFAFGQNALWQPTYYVGTFGEYDMGAVRRG
ncbi:MAG: transposase [Pirellulaceae bacterium]